MKMTKTDKNVQGFGFITNKFSEWDDSSWNGGSNGSCILYQNQWYCESQEFKLTKESLIPLWTNGDTVMVELNMKEKKGKIWNKKVPNNVFIVQLLGKKNEFTFAITLRMSSQTITIKDIQVQKYR